MDEYPSYDDPSDLTVSDLRKISELALAYMEPGEWSTERSAETFSKIAALKAYLEHRDTDEIDFRVETADTVSPVETTDRVLWITLQDAPSTENDDFPSAFNLPTEQRIENRGYGDWY